MNPRPRILLVRMGAMGDIVHTLPAAATLRHAFPDAEMDWLVEERWAPLLEGNPHLSAVRGVNLRAWPEALRRLRDLRERRYDLALDFQGLLKSAVVTRLARPREILGFQTAALREKLAGVFYDRRVAPEGLHKVEHNLSLARAAGAREDVVEFPLPCSPEEENRIARTVAPLGGFFALSPAGGWAAKRWPVERFAELIARAEKELGLGAAVNCGPGEETLAGRVLERAGSGSPPAHPVVVSGSIAGLVALARRARAFVAGDTGPLHVAAAAGTPVVAIFGPTDPARNGPYSRRARVLRAPGASTTYSRSEDGDAVARVTVDQVLEALKEML